jgi:hypothetical protein
MAAAVMQNVAANLHPAVNTMLGINLVHHVVKE